MPVRQLEDGVQRVKGQLRATIERHETQAEELKASNEELQAMNEELRSSAEELETSKEELQSLNEELRTVNQELKIKVEEQAQANDDIQNLINSTEIGTIFLDRGSRIKLFTPRARDIFTLIPADLGRPLSDISSTLVDTDLHADIERVLERLERVEREVKTRDDRWQLMRILPYRTADDRIDGVVLTFVDITAPAPRRRAGAAQRGAAAPHPGQRHRLRHRHDERQRPDRQLERRRRPHVRLHRAGSDRASGGAALHAGRSRSARPRERDAVQRGRGPRVRRALARAERRQRFFASGVIVRCAITTGP